MSLRSFSVPSVASAAVCFCELLGICSLKLRVDVKALNIILQHWNQRNTHTPPAQHLQTLGKNMQYTHTLLHDIICISLCTLSFVSDFKGAKLAEAEPGAAEELIGYLEAAVTDSLEQKGINRLVPPP